MTLTVERKGGFHPSYHVKENEKITGSTNKTYHFLRREIQSKIDSEIRWELNQTSVVRCLLRGFAFLRPFISCPYQIKQNRVLQGTAKRDAKTGYNFEVGDVVFELRPHKKGTFSLVEGNQQIALFESHCPIIGQNTYRILCVESIDISFLLCICIFIDVTYYPQEELFSDRKRIFFFVINDPGPERAYGRP